MSNNDHPIKNKIAYGNIVDINVPIPVSSSYCSANETINAKYDIRGVIMFVQESPILYAA